MQKKIDFLNQIISLLPDCICLDVKRFIACQFALESDFGLAPSACCNNNYCGMKVPAIRITLCRNLDEKGKFAQFSGIFSNVCDYLLWLSSFKFSKRELNELPLFVAHLHISGYCPEHDYIDSIYQIFNQYYSHGQSK